MIPLFNQRKTFDLLREAFYSPHKAFFNRDSRKINSSSVKRPLDSAVCTSLNTGEEKVERQGKCYVRNTLNRIRFPDSLPFVRIDGTNSGIDKSILKKHFPLS